MKITKNDLAQLNERLTAQKAPKASKYDVEQLAQLEQFAPCFSSAIAAGMTAEAIRTHFETVVNAEAARAARATLLYLASGTNKRKARNEFSIAYYEAAMAFTWSAEYGADTLNAEAIAERKAERQAEAEEEAEEAEAETEEEAEEAEAETEEEAAARAASVSKEEKQAILYASGIDYNGRGAALAWDCFGAARYAIMSMLCGNACTDLTIAHGNKNAWHIVNRECLQELCDLQRREIRQAIRSYVRAYLYSISSRKGAWQIDSIEKYTRTAQNAGEYVDNYSTEYTIISNADELREIVNGTAEGQLAQLCKAAQLTEREAKAIRLSAYYSTEEIAHKLKRSDRTTRRVLEEARQKLQAAITEAAKKAGRADMTELLQAAIERQEAEADRKKAAKAQRKAEAEREAIAERKAEAERKTRAAMSDYEKAQRKAEAERKTEAERQAERKAYLDMVSSMCRW